LDFKALPISSLGIRSTKIPNVIQKNENDVDFAKYCVKSHFYGLSYANSIFLVIHEKTYRDFPNLVIASVFKKKQIAVSSFAASE
jgi:hypothetical protein